jgi:hypothetical protein
MRVAHEGELVPGAPVEITLPWEIDLSGTVRWVNARSAGIELVGKLAVTHLESLVTKNLRLVETISPNLAQLFGAEEKLARQVR